MKITKEKLTQIIKEELEDEFGRTEPTQPEWKSNTPIEPQNLDQNANNLWEDLNALLAQWQPTSDEGIRYKQDLDSAMKQYSTDQDRPTQPPQMPPANKEY